MRFNRVLLVNPEYKGHYPAFLPAGLGYIAESLASAGIDYDFFDMNLERNLNKLKYKIKHLNPDLIGVQVMSYRYLFTYNLIRWIKKVFPHVKIVVGGHHVSSVRQTALNDNEAIDYGIVLEGEEAIVELCQDKIPVSNIKGLLYRENENVIYNGDRLFCRNLDLMPFPKYSKFPLQRYPSEIIPITSSRGCPYSCIYCPVKLTIGKEIRCRSADNIIGEFEYWYNRGFKVFFFTDDNFTFFRKRTLEICDRIRNSGLNGIQLECRNGVRADKVDSEVLGTMKLSGFTWLAFGVEGGNNKVLSAINKSESIESIEQAIKSACDFGFDVDLFFIIGSPGETVSDVQDSINLALKYPIASAEFYNLIPFPGTELFEWVKNNGYLRKSPEIYLNDASHWVNEPMFETPELPFEDRKMLFEKCKRIRNNIRFRYFKRKLSRFGILGEMAASFYVTDFFQNKILPSTRLKKIIAGVYNKIAKSKKGSIR